MKIWVDDVRQAPKEYHWCKSVNEAKELIIKLEEWSKANDLHPLLELIDLDHDAGDYVTNGGDYIKLLDWLEETGRNYAIHIHTKNPVGRENMMRIIRKNNWIEIK